ncbi:hypothetical protein [Desulfohalovibrio reitneri]|uniref:hypothetical protein n=1 Tax=Desulfohalovibrio reitneri TaxID=1307759 RepID=UPI0004A6F9F6|nr:hypothetical protein [Desulfohalovibrio reitneri]
MSAKKRKKSGKQARAKANSHGESGDAAPVAEVPRHVRDLSITVEQGVVRRLLGRGGGLSIELEYETLASIADKEGEVRLSLDMDRDDIEGPPAVNTVFLAGPPPQPGASCALKLFALLGWAAFLGLLTWYFLYV